jgi:hypothetical protein
MFAIYLGTRAKKIKNLVDSTAFSGVNGLFLQRAADGLLA